MVIDKVVVRRLAMTFKEPFGTSFAVEHGRDLLIVEAHGAGEVGYGECVATARPYYCEETTGGCQLLLDDLLVPLLLRDELHHPRDLGQRYRRVRHNEMAIAAIEGAVWDLDAKQRGLPLARALGGTKAEIEVGVSIGLQPTDANLIDKVAAAIDLGYRRVKIKIKPGRDVNMLTAVRREFPDLALMADANSAYTLADADLLAGLDELGLTMIEQPLASDDIVDHRHLQARLRTPICLDESIRNVEDARKAIELGSCRIINIKIGRIGGLSQAIAMQEFCAGHGVPVWCGGMLETGIGRAHNIAITTLPGFTLPGDTAPSSNYWHRDIIEPEVTMDRGIITVPQATGLGYAVRSDLLDELSRSVRTYTVDSINDLGEGE